MMQMNFSEAAAITFSRVSAPPPPLINTPHWSGLLGNATRPASELRSALDFGLKSEPYHLNHDLVDIGWTQAGLDGIFLEKLIREEKASWWRGGQGLLVEWDDDDEEGNKILGLSLAACAPESMPEFLMDARRRAAAGGYASVFGIFYIGPQIESALTQAGYSSHWDSAAYIYERRHPQRS